MAGEGALPISFEMIPPGIFVAAQFFKFGTSIRSLKEPLKRSVQQVMIPSFQKNFEEGGRPSWEPLSFETIQRKSNAGAKYVEEPLRRSDKLKKQMSYLKTWDIQGQGDEASASLNSDEGPLGEYGVFHQEGTQTIPARPFAVFQDEDEKAIGDVFEKWLQERILASGFTSANVFMAI